MKRDDEYVHPDIFGPWKSVPMTSLEPWTREQNMDVPTDVRGRNTTYTMLFAILLLALMAPVIIALASLI